MNTTFLVWTPFSGLGLYGGFRGNRWLRNRIKIFKQFVIPSLQNQTDHNFIHWVAWRPQERNNPHVQELYRYMSNLPNYKTIFTYGGLCMWDDKFPNDEARKKLTLALHRTLPELMEISGAEIQVLLNPSDDLYHNKTIEDIKKHFKKHPQSQAYGFKRGYLCNYHTKEILEYNPTTNPPFFAARFPREIFFEVHKHLDYISTKRDEGKYTKGVPYPSHEWIPNAFLNMKIEEGRGFLVGTHGENISTHFNHPFGGARFTGYHHLQILRDFGIETVDNLKLPVSIRKKIMRRLPYAWQRKLRYIVGEKLFNKLYTFIRN